MRFADEELKRARFEPEVHPLPDAEFEVEREVPASARAPVARKLAQVPAIVHDVQVRQTRVFNQGKDVVVELLLGIGRGRAVERVFCTGADFVQRLSSFPVQFDRFKQALHVVTPLLFSTSDFRHRPWSLSASSSHLNTGALDHWTTVLCPLLVIRSSKPDLLKRLHFPVEWAEERLLGG